MEKIIDDVKNFKDRVVKSLKKIPDMQIVFDFPSNAACNIHIIRFRNKHALSIAKKKIERIRQNPKYNDDYDILFRNICKSDESTKQTVGYIKPTQGKTYNIDIKDKLDPISQMVKTYLISKENCKIKLLVLNGCHSFILGKIFSEYVENVICIHPYVKIWDRTAIIFTKHFYSALQDYTNPRTLFKLSVLKAYMDAKINVSKQCSNDKACQSHSHIFDHDNQHHYHQSHLGENWKQLQSQINDPEQFKEYKHKYANSYISDIYDEQHLIISNISEFEMKNLINYLQDYDSSVIEYKYINDQDYAELSYAYLKFESTEHRRTAMKILEKKKYDEEITFSNKWIFERNPNQDDEKKNCGSGLYSSSETDNKYEYEYENISNLGWNHRVVPRCCCAPHHPHLAQDKLILIQDGKIINRTIIKNIQQIKSGLNDMRKKKEYEKKTSTRITKNDHFRR